MCVYHSVISRLLVLLVFILISLPGCRSSSPSHVKNSGHRVGYIDCHNHIFAGPSFGGRNIPNYPGAVRSAIRKMDELGIDKMIVMPPPISPENSGIFSLEDLVEAIQGHPGRFEYVAGGESLNVMIHQSADDRNIDGKIMEKFREKALDILKKGAVGFGEFAVEHFSFNIDHPYESVRADHPLFLMLADIAAEQGVPIDIHMEAVPKDMPLPERKILQRSKKNPDYLRENIKAFERLLSHNRRAKIIWSHVGWCNTGYRTPELCGGLLGRHKNLYMSFKLSRESVRDTRPLTRDKRQIKKEWLNLISAFPDRFIIGTDQFYSPPGTRQIGPQKTQDIRIFIDLLPPDLAFKIGIENPRRIFSLGS